MPQANMIERTTKPSAKRGSKKWGKNLEALADFETDVPRLHIGDDIKVVTINGKSYGMVRRLGGGMFFWSGVNGEGREETEEAAFMRLGFLYFLNSKGERRIKKIGSKFEGKLAPVDFYLQE